MRDSNQCQSDIRKLSPYRESRRIAYVENQTLVDLTSAAFVDLVLFDARDPEVCSVPRINFGARIGLLTALGVGNAIWLEAFRETYETGAPVRTAFGLPMIWAPPAVLAGSAQSFSWLANTYGYRHPAHTRVVYGLRGKIDAFSAGSARVRWCYAELEFLPEVVTR